MLLSLPVSLGIGDTPVNCSSRVTSADPSHPPNLFLVGSRVCNLLDVPCLTNLTCKYKRFQVQAGSKADGVVAVLFIVMFVYVVVVVVCSASQPRELDQRRDVPPVPTAVHQRGVRGGDVSGGAQLGPHRGRRSPHVGGAGVSQ